VSVQGEKKIPQTDRHREKASQKRIFSFLKVKTETTTNIFLLSLIQPRHPWPRPLQHHSSEPRLQPVALPVLELALGWAVNGAAVVAASVVAAVLLLQLPGVAGIPYNAAMRRTNKRVDARA
jgi:hypothetical protein